MSFAEVPLQLSSASHLTINQYSGQAVLRLQEYNEMENSNNVNNFYYEKMFKSIQFFDDSRCEAGNLSFSGFVDNRSIERTLIW